MTSNQLMVCRRHCSVEPENMKLFQTQQNKFVNWQGDAEFRGEDFTATVTLGNPDVLVGSGIVVTHYLQSITPSLALGGSWFTTVDLERRAQ
ncbi:hypothetical protein INR49_006770 [Caranx melampygus]|nr:hypothetical protein INR49_006770 [Caranx melampygus]